MKEKYNQLMYKAEFIRVIASKLQLDPETVRIYFNGNKIPKMHYERIDKALDIKLAEDNKIREMRVNSYEMI